MMSSVRRVRCKLEPVTRKASRLEMGKNNQKEEQRHWCSSTTLEKATMNQEAPLSPSQADEDWLFADVTTESFEHEKGEEKDVGSIQCSDEEDENEDRVHRFLPQSLSQSQLSRGNSNHQSPTLKRSPSSSARLLPPVVDIPPQLHPAVSLGVRRVSSCYFSLGSQDSMADLLSQFGDGNQQRNNTVRDDASGIFSASTWMDGSHAAEDVLYHDILMNVFNFLDAQSLKTFSETARRPNYEVFYYLQLQLQQALLVGDSEETDNQEVSERRKRTERTQRHHYTIAGSAALSRLATLDMDRAQQVVHEYLQSNSTLRTMPLSHSLAYARRYLMHHGFSKMFPNNNKKSA